MSQPSSEARVSSKLPLGLKAVYGTGQFVDSVSSTALATFLLFYLTAVCGLSGSLTGVSLFVALTVDAFVDPFVGSISDNTASRWGRRHLFMFASFPLMFVGLGMLFTVPVWLHGMALFVYVTAMALILRIGLSAYIVPYIALGAELSDDYLERSRVIAWRSFFSVPATIVPIVLGYTVFLGGKAGLFNRAAYVPFGWTCAAILCLLGGLAAFGTLGAIGRLHKTVPSTDHPLRRLVREVPEVFRNRSFLILFATVLVFFVAQGTAAALNLHGGKFFWKLPVPTIQLLSITGALGLLLGIPLVAVIGPYVEKRTMTLWSLLYIVVFQAGMPLLRIAGILPPNGAALTTILVVNGVLIYAAVTVLAISFQSMMADAADEHELLFGARREGLYFSGTTFSAKAASGIGSFLAGVALDLIHFPVDIAAKGGDNLHLSAATVDDLGLVYGVGPAAMTALCIAINYFYRIDRHAHARIQAELVARRGAAADKLGDIEDIL
ncbi:MAG TPA: MFS transporter [Rhizomicrobium sp.]|jgi:GPH family glycoside/pentoside/hexuronide:cation symporter|nr:MFS transporter [Rhizomicrobium sp.]